MISRFSKRAKDILQKAQFFVETNDTQLKFVREIDNVYARQALRRTCKLCESVPSDDSFRSAGITYWLCGLCGHLNGQFAESKSFLSFVYGGEDSEFYEYNYSQHFEQRVRDIYLPKADFLLDVLRECGHEKPQTMRVLDFGSGAGQFLRALELTGVSACGWEANDALHQVAIQHLESNQSIKVDSESSMAALADSKADVLALIGVLEHVEDPRLLLNSFRSSECQYLYLVVPMMSLSALLQQSFSKVFPRQLGADHTHLFTARSIQYLCDYWGLSIVGEWWFGTDIVDLYRSLVVSSENASDSTYLRLMESYLGAHIDEIQSVIDKARQSSEVHLVLQRII